MVIFLFETKKYRIARFLMLQHGIFTFKFKAIFRILHGILLYIGQSVRLRGSRNHLLSTRLQALIKSLASHRALLARIVYQIIIMRRSVCCRSHTNRAAAKSKFAIDNLPHRRRVQHGVEINGRFFIFDFNTTAWQVIIRLPSCHIFREFCPLRLVIEIVSRF